MNNGRSVFGGSLIKETFPDTPKSREKIGNIPNVVQEMLKRITQSENLVPEARKKIEVLGRRLKGLLGTNMQQVQNEVEQPLATIEGTLTAEEQQIVDELLSTEESDVETQKSPRFIQAKQRGAQYLMNPETKNQAFTYQITDNPLDGELENDVLVDSKESPLVEIEQLALDGLPNYEKNRDPETGKRIPKIYEIILPNASGEKRYIYWWPFDANNPHLGRWCNVGDPSHTPAKVPEGATIREIKKEEERDAVKEQITTPGSDAQRETTALSTTILTAENTVAHGQYVQTLRERLQIPTASQEVSELTSNVVSDMAIHGNELQAILEQLAENQRVTPAKRTMETQAISEKPAISEPRFEKPIPLADVAIATAIPLPEQISEMSDTSIRAAINQIFEKIIQHFCKKLLTESETQKPEASKTGITQHAITTLEDLLTSMFPETTQTVSQENLLQTEQENPYEIVMKKTLTSIRSARQYLNFEQTA